MHPSSARDVRTFVTVFQKLGNPFQECTTVLLTLDNKEIMDAPVVGSNMSADQTGFVQYEACAPERITGTKGPVT